MSKHKNNKDPDFSYINDNNKKVSGAAAFLHEVFTNHEGIADYNDDVGEEYIKEFVKQISSNANANLEATSKRKQIKKHKAG